MSENKSQLLVNKIMRTGVSFALVAGMSIPVGLQNAYAEENEKSAEKSVVEQVAAESQVADMSVAKITASADDPVLAGPVVLSDNAESPVAAKVTLKGDANSAYFYLEPANDDTLTEATIEKFTEAFNSMKEQYALSIKGIKVKDGVKIKLNVNDPEKMTYGLQNLEDIEGLAAFDISSQTTLSNMFYDCRSLTDLSPIAKWDTSGVTDFTHMFENCQSLTSIDSLKDWDVSKVETMENMFSGCSDLSKIDVGLANWTTTELASTRNMFEDCVRLQSTKGLENFRFAYEKEMTEIRGWFYGCTSLTDLSGLSSINIDAFEDTSKIFYGCTSLTDLTPIANWDMSQIIDMDNLFNGCTSLTNIDALANWDVSSMQNMEGTFYGCSSLTNIDGLKNWKVKSGYIKMVLTFSDCPLTNLDAFNDWDFANMRGNFQMTFRNCSKLNSVDLTNWANVYANGMNQFMFDNIAPSNIRSFKMFDVDEKWVSFLSQRMKADVNIFDVDRMFDSSLVYRIKGTDTTYTTLDDLINDYDQTRGKWIEVVQTHTVNFYETDNFDKLPVAIQKIPDGQHPVGVTEPTIKGASFNGWYVKDSAGKETKFDFVAPVTGDVNVYAKWVEADTTSDDNGKGEVLDPDKVIVYVINATYTEDGVEKPLDGAKITFENGKINVVSDKSADNIKVHVETDGKAAKGVTVAYDGTSVTTDASGNAVFYSDRGITDSNGKVTLVDPSTGEKRIVTVTDENRKPLKGAEVQIKNGRIVVTNPITKDIIVKVTDGDNKAKKGVGVAVIGAKGTISSGNTDANGEYKSSSKSSDSGNKDSGDSDEVGTQVMYRLYNKWTGEHFYTADKDEQKNLVKVGWTDEGTGWIAPTKSNTPVYRLYNSYVEGGDHHYTMSKDERDACVKAGWTDEGIGWYSDDNKTVALYRQYNPYAVSGLHNYTTNINERYNVVAAGWTDEGLAWYGVDGERY